MPYGSGALRGSTGQISSQLFVGVAQDQINALWGSPVGDSISANFAYAAYSEGGSAFYSGYRVRTSFEAPTHVTGNNTLCRFQGWGWNGANSFNMGGEFTITTVESWVDGVSNGCKASILATSNGSNAATERLKVQDTVEILNAGFTRSSDISPTALAGNTDNWAPTNFATAAIIRASASAPVNLTGIAAGSDGREIVLINVGAQIITLIHDLTSTAANRFLLPNSANLALNPNDSVTLWYDSTSSRWRAIGV